MIDTDVFVIDATVHAFNFMPSNYNADFVPDMMQMLYHGATKMFSPPDDPKWTVTWEQFIGMFPLYPDLLHETLFGESGIDVAVYHGVPLEGVYKDGSSPTWVAKAVRELFPNRMHLYSPLYPWRADACDEIDRLVEEDQPLGLKFYPLDVINNEFRPSIMNSESTFEVVRHAASRGIKMIAIHKAVPLGPLPLEPFGNVDDCFELVAAFPDTTFEIVHGGVAFLPETARLAAEHSNVAINLEGTASFAVQMKDQLIPILEALLDAGAAKRMFWSSAAMGGHPQPPLEAFWNLELPSGRLTRDVKVDILGRNFARHVGWNLDDLPHKLADDRYGQQVARAEPWSYLNREWKNGVMK
jgi:uncharacterized protein